MTDEAKALVERLRHDYGDWICDEAADLIETQAREIERLREALLELADLMDDVVAGAYRPDSFTCQPARAALAGDSHD